jgi:diacylglycerol kinase (ATP)
VIVRNPAARRAVAVDRLRAAIREMERLAWSIELLDTAAAGDAIDLAREAARDRVSVVVACGGDGTINEVANGLVGTSTALAAIPAGTANIWGKEAFLPSDPTRALALLERGRRARVDLGLARIGTLERRFLLMCGAGLDAAVVAAVEARGATKRRLGRAAFVLPTARTLLAAQPARVTLTVDGDTQPVTLLLAVAGNTRLYGGVLHLASAARIDDGLLDLVTFEDPRPDARGRIFRYGRLLARAARGRLETASTPGIGYRRAGRIEIRPETELPVQVDGEWLGVATAEAPLVLESLPGALEVIVAPRANVLLGEHLTP